ncbi:MAG TPA: LLM class F420-dependent oxidoreductase [Rhizomicrobium sp.]|nr:LLM class F420-dependent oxidoreductase [Rhizomicrobium sp.]
MRAAQNATGNSIHGAMMQFGAAIFFTEYSIGPIALALALEERGFESLWAPEHSHIPVSRKSPYPGGGELPKEYYDVMDPFVTLSAAAAATRTLKVATGICLLQQRDVIQTAKLVASIDQISNGRFLFGIGGGWNREEMENHGTDYATRFQRVREGIEAMKEIWTRPEAEYHGEIVKFDPIFAWPKPVQKPHPPILVGGGFPQGARRAIRYGDGWLPIMGAKDLAELVPKYQAMAKEAGRDIADVPISAWHPRSDAEAIKRFRDLGVVRIVTTLPPAGRDKILPILDRYAEAMQAAG